MPSAALILTVIAGLLFLIALVPREPKWPLEPVGGLLLSVALFLIAYK